MKDPRLSNISVGEILSEDFLRPNGLTAKVLAEGLAIPVSRVRSILKGKTSITPDTAMRLAAFFQTSPGMWLNAQAQCDAFAAEDLQGKILKEVKPFVETSKGKKAA